MHVSSNGYGMYLYEARQRWFSYPPPYYLGGSWYWATPWLWYDGDPHSDWYTTWESKIANRMNQPAPVTTTMWGDYNSATGNGTIYAQFRNDSTATLNGNVLFVVTEDSIITSPPVPNGDVWHNYVARDYMPSHIGEPVSVPAGDSVIVSQAFTIDAGWNEDQCKILTWIQDDVLQPDSVKEVWQGGMIDLVELGIEEHGAGDVSLQKVNVAPNPCVDGTKFSFNLPAAAGSEYKIDIFDVTGRHVRTLSGLSSGNQEVVAWNLKDDTGFVVGAGVYLFRFESSVVNTNGKIVVR